jgi:hypothetical protein
MTWRAISSRPYKAAAEDARHALVDEDMVVGTDG